MPSPFDIIIIGGGPAGLSCATSIVRQIHSTLIIDSGLASFRAAARKDFERYGTVQIEDAEVASVKKTDEGLFQLTSTSGKVWECYKLVLATGVTDVYLKIEGYADCWATGIFHCLFCHGWEERDVLSSGILAERDLAEQLDLKKTPQGTIQVNPPFNQTSVKGVFAAGDAANPMQIVAQAIFSGTLCGGGAPSQLQAERLGQEAVF